MEISVVDLLVKIGLVSFSRLLAEKLTERNSCSGVKQVKERVCFSLITHSEIAYDGL